MQDYNETHVIECGMNGLWKTNITDICRIPNTMQTQTGED